MASLKKRATDVYNWFEHRLGLGAPAIEAAEHEVPSSTSSWWYVFGSAATVILVLQVVTGILLALVYAPTAGHAWSSLEFLDHNVALGWYLRALHGWGSDFMVAIVLFTWRRSSSSGPTNTRASSPGSSAYAVPATSIAFPRLLSIFPTSYSFH